MPRKFDFISPGIELREVDESQLPTAPEKDGILLIGRARSGPAMKPIKINNLNDFVDVFGLPMDGVRTQDPWRQGNTGAPNYAAYAAQAYLAADVGPVKYIRLLGIEKDSTTANRAGWNMGSSPNADLTKNAGAFGIFLANSGSNAVGTVTASYTDVIRGTTAADQRATIISKESLCGFKVNVPSGIGGAGTDIQLHLTTSVADTPPANEIYILSKSAGAAANIAQFAAAIIGNASAANVKYGSSAGDITNGVAGLTASIPSTANTRLTLRATTAGGLGNRIVVTNLGSSSYVNSSPSYLFGGQSNVYVTGTLAAIMYLSGAALGISGTIAEANASSTTTTALSASTLIYTNGADYGLRLGLSNSSGLTYHDVNFNENSPKYIRTVLNTDPTNFFNNANYQGTDESYFLGETFDLDVSRLGTGATAGDAYAFVANLDYNGNDFDDFNQELAASKSGWFIGAQPTQKYLFRLVSLNDGTEFQNNYYVRIYDVKLATALQPEGSFSLQIVKKGTNIKKDLAVETYAGLTLNPDSANYIVKRIGDLNVSWSTSQQKFSTSGMYPNISDFVRVEIASGLNKSDVPVGFVGPQVFPDLVITTAMATGSDKQNLWINAGENVPLVDPNVNEFIGGWPTGSTHLVEMRMQYPYLGLTTANTKFGSNYSYNDNFGLRHVKSNRLTWDGSFQDHLLKRTALDPHCAAGASFASASYVFSLDDIRSGSHGATTYNWISGGYDNSQSISQQNGLADLINNKKIKQFIAPFFGGADGIDIRYADPFSNARVAQAGGTDFYPNYTVDQAIEMTRDPDNMRFELISMPGMVTSGPSDKIIDIASDRGDALAVVDFDGIFRPTWDTESSEQAASMTTLRSTLETRLVDNSYACTYYPNVRIKDNLNNNNTVFKAPPSVAAIGAIAKSEADSQPWFAPAGFNRGGISRLGGTSGPTTVGTVEHLTKDNRDTLYALNVNPIARFPATGDTVIFGQKTMQVAASALDRINVRRLMIYLKRHIGDIAETILFDQNVQVTWTRFRGQAEQVLNTVQAELGITEYKLVLDEIMSSPEGADLIDRNIMYAKVFVKPARAIEFIAIDFIITRTGVEF